MRISAFFLMLLFNVLAFSSPSFGQNEIIKSIDALKRINEGLLTLDDEDAINALLGKRLGILDSLMMQLRLTSASNLPPFVVNKDLMFLESRIKVNTKRANHLATQRDLIRLEGYKANQAIKVYLEYLIDWSRTYKSIEAIIKKSQQLLDESVKKESELSVPELDAESSVFLALKKNYQMFLRDNDSYQDILLYVINHPRKIASIHWFQEFSLLSAISYINQFDVVQSVNHRLAPFKIDVGGIALSLVIFFLVYFSYPFIFRCTSWCVENYIIDTGDEHQELIYHQVRRPLRALLIFLGLNLSAYAFFYRTDYKSSLEGVSFIIYSLIFIWLFFKIIDSFVLVQVQKLSSSNKALRKELFNLGVQSVKGLLVIIILAFGLNHFGISLTAIISTLGVGGLAFALAAKDTLSNLFGGMSILFDNVFRIGDWIKVGDVEGTVAEIGLRSTTVRTFDNALITIPNALISVSSVINWSRRAVGRRIKMYIGVTYESDMNDLRQGLSDIREMLSNHPDIANPAHKHGSHKKGFKFLSQEDAQGIKSTQLVFMDRYNDFSIDILIYCFAKTVNWAEWLAVKEDVLFKIADILKQNNLEFAYPTEVRINQPEKNRVTNSSRTIDVSMNRRK